MLQLLITPQKVIRISLRHNFPHIRLLHKILISLFLRKSDSILFALEVDVCALHEIGGRLPAHQRILPSVALREDVPVHAPVVAVPVAGLGRGFGFFVDSGRLLVGDAE